MILLMIVVLGAVAMFSIPLDLMPDIEAPVALVTTTYSGASPEEVESMVTETLEASLASVEDLDTLYSYSMENTSIIVLMFNYDTDMDFATLNMREKIALVSDYLPDSCTEPMVMKMSMNMMPTAQIYISSGSMTLAELNTLVDSSIVPQLERASGVASTTMMGGVEEEVSIKFNQEALTNYGLSLSTVSQLLAAENVNLPIGDISKGDTELIVRSMGKFSDVEDIKNLPLTISDYSVVRLGDIAEISYGYKDQEAITRINAETAIGVMVTKASDANTVEVSDEVRSAIEKLSEKYPDINIVIGYDAADYIKSSIRSVAESAIIGALLAIIVVFLFLRNVKTTLIIALSIPTSLLAAFAVMDALDMTLNLITLCALTICVGMLVDNSIVVLEDIFRIRQEEPDPIVAANKASKEIFLAVVASTLTTVLVFLPIALSEGMASLIFADFCWTIIIALMASLVVALTVIPMLCSKLMAGTVSTEYMRFGTKRYKYKLLPLFGRFIEYITEKYDEFVRVALKKRKKVLVGCTLIFIVSLLLIFTLGLEMLPDSDEGMISLSVEVPYGTSLETTDSIMSKIEDYLLALPETESVVMSTGSVSALSLNSNASLSLQLVDKSERDRSADEIAKAIQKDMSKIAEASITAQSSSSFSSYFGSNDVSLLLKGSDFETLESIGNDLRTQISQLECVTDAALDISEGSPEVKVIIDRNAASYYGITAYQMASGLSSAISGSTATRLTVDGTEIDVKLSLSDNVADSVEDMKQIKITGSYGTSVPVAQIATFEYDNAPSYIYRENQTNTITLNVDVDSTSVTGGATEVMKIVNNYQFPEGYYADENGIYSTMTDAFTSLTKALFVAIALVFLLLAAQFESVIMSLVVMLAVPFAMTGAFLALFLTGTSLSMTSFLGLIMLVGIVVNNSILLVEFIRQYQDELGLYEALVQAGKLRLRPILMSCVTTVVGMIPLSLGFGDGGEILAPMGISIIGGLVASTVVTLFIVPVFYSLVEERKQRKAKRKLAKAEKLAALEAEWAKEDSVSGQQ